MRALVPRAMVPLLLAACGQGAPASWLTDPGVAGHARYLLLAGTPHDPGAPGATVTCDGCHTAETFKVFACTTCHPASQADPLHAGLTGYAAGAVTSDACYRCHPQGLGVMSAADHARFFTIGTASHPAVCTQCHTDLAHRADLAKLACASCHGARPGFGATHAQVKDYPLSPGNEWCLRCHADDQVDRIAAHGAQRGLAGSAGPGDARHDTHCFQCHTMVPPAPPFAGPPPGVASRPWAEDWKVATCTKCH